MNKVIKNLLNLFCITKTIGLEIQSLNISKETKNAIRQKIMSDLGDRESLDIENEEILSLYYNGCLYPHFATHASHEQEKHYFSMLTKEIKLVSSNDDTTSISAGSKIIIIKPTKDDEVIILEAIKRNLCHNVYN